VFGCVRKVLQQAKLKKPTTIFRRFFFYRKKIVGFLILLILLGKIPFQRTQTLIVSKTKWRRKLKKLTKFRRRPSLKNHK
jgi:hypothetical protein